MKFWNDVKIFLISMLALQSDSTDAEVHQAVLDAQAKKAKSPDEVVDDTQAAAPAAIVIETTTEETAPQTVSIEAFNALQAQLTATQAQLTALAKSSKSSAVAAATETTATEPTKKRAYMTTPLSKKVYETK